VLEELPVLGRCVEWARAAGVEAVETWTPPGAPIYWSGGMIEDEFAELIWWPSRFVEERLDAILAAEIVDHRRIRTAEAIAHGIVLRTAGAAAEWQERLRAYPSALGDAIVADAAESWGDLPRSELALLRPGDGLALAGRLVEDAENVLRIVFALNSSWEPGWKHLPRSVAPLAVTPERLVERIEAALGTHDLGAMRELVRDTLALAPGLPTVVAARRHVDAMLEELA
jgi:hypothetical protein